MPLIGFRDETRIQLPGVSPVAEASSFLSCVVAKVEMESGQGENETVAKGWNGIEGLSDGTLRACKNALDPLDSGVTALYLSELGPASGPF